MITLCNMRSVSVKLYFEIWSKMLMPQYSSRLRLGQLSSSDPIFKTSESPRIWIDLIISRLSVMLIRLKSTWHDRKLIAVVLARRIEQSSVRSSFSIVPWSVTVSKVAWAGGCSCSLSVCFFGVLGSWLNIRFVKKKCCLSSAIRLRDICQSTRWIFVDGDFSWIKETSIGRLRKSLPSRTTNEICLKTWMMYVSDRLWRSYWDCVPDYVES